MEISVCALLSKSRWRFQGDVRNNNIEDLLAFHYLLQDHIPPYQDSAIGPSIAVLLHTCIHAVLHLNLVW